MLEYDPKKCARYEVRAWQAHHIGAKARLAYYLLRHQMEVFDVGPIVAIRALLPLLPAIRAHNVRKKEEAIEHTTNYYTYLEQHIDYNFDPHIAAEQEVEWWWIHDELEHELDKAPLIQAFANLYSTILSIPAAELLEAAAHKVLATIQHDIAEGKNTPVTETILAWRRTERALSDFYTALQKAEGGTNERLRVDRAV